MATVGLRKGWFKLEGQDGDRALEEQLFGVEPALAECRGKTVLDIGCAEGLIGREFVRSGASHVHGIDSVAEHIDVARSVCAGLPMSFEVSDLNHSPDPFQRDIVLALAVIHKAHNPAEALKFAANSAMELLVIRLPLGSNGYMQSKFSDSTIERGPMRRSVNLLEVLPQDGFHLERTLPGPRGELVQYWRR